MMTDPIADMLTRIRNALHARRDKVDIPGSRLKLEIARILKDEGYIQNFKRMKLRPVILCSPRLRPHFKRFIERSFPDLAVLSYNEIVPQVKVQSIGMISTE